jgi:hypothetical protein
MGSYKEEEHKQDYKQESHKRRVYKKGRSRS